MSYQEERRHMEECTNGSDSPHLVISITDYDANDSIKSGGSRRNMIKTTPYFNPFVVLLFWDHFKEHSYVGIIL